MDWFISEEKTPVKILGLSLTSQLDSDAYIVSVAKTVSKKRALFIFSRNFLSPEYVVYLCKPSIPSCVE